ncbi:hypothetical protein [Glycomyces dulcitolivorans]|uniref:hypothetical protein n=1 Tax=Glycomyces dulcitolivorans TaxID=2200759 RepID=UPI00130023D4|nr:hypothetical protein [Glycomyces dulcitolivorans]
MTYPSQPGYPSPYGQQLPPNGRQNNNLWLIGGSVVLVLVILMTVILLVVQQTQNDNSADGGTDGGGDTDYSGLDSVPFDSTACDSFDASGFADAVGDTIDEGSSSNYSSSSDSYDSITCSFYTAEQFIYITANFYDYGTLDEVMTYIDYDDEMYGTDADYEMSDYTDLGDGGNVYTNISDPSYQSTYIHVALGSVEASVYASYDASTTDKDAVINGLSDIIAQADALFADYQ